MSRKQRIIVSITGIVIVSLILIGLTYAYFLTRVTGNTNDKSISVTTANLQVKYEDNKEEILGKNLILEPSDNEIGSKTFTVTNEGNAKTNYGVSIENVTITKSSDGTTTTFESNDFKYTLTCTKKDGNDCDKQIDEQKTFPIDGGIVVTNDIEVNDVHTYTLKMWYIDTGIDQSKDMGKNLQAKLNIVDTAALTINNPYKNDTGTLKKTIIDNAMLGTSTTKMGSEVTTFTSVSGANDRLLNTAPDDYGTSYYYYGAVTDNYVSFANKLWRIVRINGDGSIRLVLDDVAKNSSGSVITTAYYPSGYDNAYIGYMTGTPGSTTYDAAHENKGTSKIKMEVDSWYKTNIVDTNNNDYVADTLFCNDKTLASDGIGGVTTQLGYGENDTYYSSAERLQYSTGTTEIIISKPTFKCAQTATNDYSRFTKSITTLPIGNKTNGNLTYSVGLLSADEVAYAGAYKLNQKNKTYYLYNSSISSICWLMSPNRRDNLYTQEKAYIWTLMSDGDLSNKGYTSFSVASFRPVINLKADILLSAGDGTKENPYVVLIN